MLLGMTRVSMVYIVCVNMVYVVWVNMVFVVGDALLAVQHARNVVRYDKGEYSLRSLCEYGLRRLGEYGLRRLGEYGLRRLGEYCQPRWLSMFFNKS